CRPPGAGEKRRDWAAGTALLLRTEALREVGPFDESYFLYCEDIDWCHRARRQGWEVWASGDALAVHARSSSVNSAGSWVDVHRIGSLNRYYARTHGRLLTLAFVSVRAGGLLGRAFVFWLLAGLRHDDGLAQRARQRRADARLALRIRG